MRTVIEAMSDMLDREIGDRDDIRASTAHHVSVELLYIELKRYCEEIIDECAGSFECTMETEDVDDQTGDKVKVTEPYPVLVRKSVLDVKRKL